MTQDSSTGKSPLQIAHRECKLTLQAKLKTKTAFGILATHLPSCLLSPSVYQQARNPKSPTFAVSQSHHSFGFTTRPEIPTTEANQHQSRIDDDNWKNSQHTHQQRTKTATHTHACKKNSTKKAEPHTGHVHV